MSKSKRMLQDHLLDLLIDGPSSFAALYGALRRHYDHRPSLSVDGVLDTLFVMEKSGLIRSQMMTKGGKLRDVTNEDRSRSRVKYQLWLGGAAWEDLSVDEIGLWYNVTPKGRGAWKRWSKAEKGEARERWVLDDVTNSHSISIHAESLRVAEKALLSWLSSNPNIELVTETKRIEPIHEFEMRDGTLVLNGVKLLCSYRRRGSTSDSTPP